ncbi:GldG family protein [Henriciella sp.]|uniref:GldG family protein n=1 Tax=Henriciella sp. TaxID=1968823 RepID=UPI002627CE37|nr:GldG family protein [Henriciella sp.]
MSLRVFTLTASVLVAAIFVAASLIAQPLLRTVRFDFTENSLFTLSEGTRTVLEDLDEPVELTFVYTRRIGQEFPAIRAYATRVRELLDGYKAVAGANLRIREIDPEPFSEAEDEALAAGVTAVNSDGDDPLYFGLIGTNTVDDQRVIPFLAPEQEETLEYDLTRMIARLDRLEPPTVGVLSTLEGMKGDGTEGGYTFLQEMARNFDLAQIEEDFFSLPADMDVLLMVHPPELSDWQAWLVDQFILRNGRAVILVDPAAKTSRRDASGLAERRIRSDLGRFSDIWGISLSEEALADTESALPIQSSMTGGRSSVIRHPLYLSATPALMPGNSMITADLSRSVNFGAPGALILEEGSPIDKRVLIETGPAPSWIPSDRAVTDLTAQDTLELYEPLEGARPLAARVHGALVTAFPNGAPAPEMPEDPVMAELARAAVNEAAPHITTSERDAEILVVSDADMVDDGLYVNLESATAFADNGAFLMNALDVLSGDANLLSLRARASSRRPMSRVEDMRDEAQARYFDEQARLEDRLVESESRLKELQQAGASDSFFQGDVEADLSEEERAELARLRTEIVETRTRLRTIERDFRHEIDSLEAWLKFINIFGGAIVIGLIGCLVWWRRRRKGAA